MKKTILIVCFLSIGLVQAQGEKPTYKKVGDLVQVTYYYTNGVVKETGFFKANKLTGTWERFDEKGKKVAIAHYTDGRKTGKWFLWKNNSLKEINYNNNALVSVQTWKEDAKLAVN